MNSILHLQPTIRNQTGPRFPHSSAEERNAALTPTTSPHFEHSFVRIPVSPPNAGALQTKLSIANPGDEYEQEADRVAEQVIRMPDSSVRSACSYGGGRPNCQTEQSGRGHEHVQTKGVGSSGSGLTDAPPIVRKVLASPGQPLSPATRDFMEPRFGYDFSRVRVHSGAAAETSARDMGAHAYTAGLHIVFGAGQYRPETPAGKRLLAHEMVHVVQQYGSPGVALQRQTTSNLFDVSPEIVRTPSLEDQAIKSLTFWLEQIRREQGREALQLTLELHEALSRLDVTPFANVVENLLNKPATPNQPAELAQAVIAVLHPVDGALLDRIARLRPPKAVVPKKQPPSIVDRARHLYAGPRQGLEGAILNNLGTPKDGGPTARDRVLKARLGQTVPGSVGPYNITPNFYQVLDALERRQRLQPRKPPPLDPEAVARIANTIPPWYLESEVPGGGALSGLELDTLIVKIAAQLRDKAGDGETQVVVDLGSGLPPTPPTFEIALRLIADLLKQELHLPSFLNVQFKMSFDPNPLGRTIDPRSGSYPGRYR